MVTGAGICDVPNRPDSKSVAGTVDACATDTIFIPVFVDEVISNASCKV